MERAISIDGTIDRIQNLPSEWTSGTTCTGCGTFEMSLRSVAHAISGHRALGADDIEVTCLMHCFVILCYSQLLTSCLPTYVFSYTI